MTRLDIERIERELAVQLPRAYQELLVDYPLSQDSFGTCCMVIRDPDALIECNQGRTAHFMLHHRPGRWTPGNRYFLIGNDGGEEEYYLDLSSPECHIFRFDLESGELTAYAKGIEDYVRKIQEIDREVQEDERRAEERRSSAKWWEFWKKL